MRAPMWLLQGQEWEENPLGYFCVILVKQVLDLSIHVFQYIAIPDNPPGFLWKVVTKCEICNESQKTLVQFNQGVDWFSYSLPERCRSNNFEDYL